MPPWKFSVWWHAMRTTICISTTTFKCSLVQFWLSSCICGELLLEFTEFLKLRTHVFQSIWQSLKQMLNDSLSMPHESSWYLLRLHVSKCWTSIEVCGLWQERRWRMTSQRRDPSSRASNTEYKSEKLSGGREPKPQQWESFGLIGPEQIVRGAVMCRVKVMSAIHRLGWKQDRVTGETTTGRGKAAI